MDNEKKFALLIDADNVSSKYIEIVTKEAQTLGNVTIRRIYGDWTSSSKNSWKDSLLENSLTPIQQYNYTVGKNSSDSAMIIDAMDVLYTCDVDGFIIVSSDSDFTKLAVRLRESGKRVIGMGESKTPTPFVRACEQFKTLDVLYKNNNQSPKHNSQEHRNTQPERGRRQSQKNQEPEKAPVKELFDNPLHPYTRALFSAIPMPDPDMKINRTILEGDIPSPANPPKGCKFHTRCKDCMAVCKEVAPEERDVGNGHMVRCHLYDQG